MAPSPERFLIIRASSANVDLYVRSGIGNPSGGNGVGQNPFLFAGGIQDRATGLIKFGARRYNPTTGRWTQQDSLDNPFSHNNANRYADAGNDPIDNLDPTGFVCGQAIQAGALGVVAAGLASAQRLRRVPPWVLQQALS